MRFGLPISLSILKRFFLKTMCFYGDWLCIITQLAAAAANVSKPFVVPFSRLFLYADTFDWFLMVFGSFAAAAHGIALVVYLHFFGKIIHFMSFKGSTSSGDQLLDLFQKKMGLTVESVRDCSRAVVRLPTYIKAWYRRGMANASMGNYEDAIQDLDIAMNMELSLGGNSRIKEELEIIRKQSRRVISKSPNKASSMNHSSIVDPPQAKLKCVSTSTKGRGIVSTVHASPASLIHFEEPYVVIITKACRKTHCHFCLNELPADIVPCSSCSMTLYCSQNCQEQAIGQRPGIDLNSILTSGDVSTDLKRYVERISLENNSGYPVAGSNPNWVAEHKHECGGVHWPSVLPTEIVLAGRILVKTIEAKNDSKGAMDSPETLDLCHDYGCMTPETKLETHILLLFSLTVFSYLMQLKFH